MKQEITGHTALYCLLGSPVAHSISPQMHNASFIYHGIDARYLAFDVKPEQLADAVNGLKAIGVKGFNLTMPLKREMVPFCDHALSQSPKSAAPSIRSSTKTAF